jgi:hypothetical protein
MQKSRSRRAYPMFEWADITPYVTFNTELFQVPEQVSISIIAS